MFEPDQYALLEFGEGTKIEFFAGQLVLRETKSVGAEVAFAEADVSSTSEQSQPHGTLPTSSYHPQLAFRFGANRLGANRFGANRLGANRLGAGLGGSGPNQSTKGDFEKGSWIGQVKQPWLVKHRQKQFLLKPTPAGQIGLFPEQATNWSWIEDCGSRSKSLAFKDLKALNLFAYTGGTTMSLATRGASVVHLDAARNVVSWAKENAAQSGLANAPIRWIVDDVSKFVAREIKRGNQYDILVADPPSFGMGPKREKWKLSDHIEDLFAGLSRLAAPRLSMLILSCHTYPYDAQELMRLARRYFDLSHGKLTGLPLKLVTRNGRELVCGHCVRFLSDEISDEIAP